MRDALDGFEIEGIGHNLPFLSAVMDHPRFVEGAISTGFIAEEYPEGFAGAELPPETLGRLAALAAHIHSVRETRAAQIFGAIQNHGRKLGSDWVVLIDRVAWPLSLRRDGTRSTARFPDGREVGVLPTGSRGRPWCAPRSTASRWWRGCSRWRPACAFATAGPTCGVAVLPPRQAELAALMPEKLPPDTSKLLLCPMPGLVVRIDVAEGDEVFDGQALAMVEAMKMENVLRAERRARVAKVRARPGDSLAVDDVILEFE